ncbi:MAG: hypothetical protein MI810_10725 [Flavobacteriales bacterium]|nr:hypothetical protein [Flavobacteriales bacterium]
MLSVRGQNVDSIGVVDNVFIDITYDRDTTVNFYSNVELSWIDSVGGSFTYEFLEGNKSYLEISIQKQSNVTHSSSNEIIIIEVDITNACNVIKLTPANTTWLIRASWLYMPFIREFKGTLDFENHELEFYSRIDLQRNMFVEGKIIEHELFARDKLY